MTEDEKRIEKIRNAHRLILCRENINDTLQERITALQFLEKELNVNFHNTEDFLDKMDKYVIQISGAEELKRARESKNLSQEQLSKKLGYSQPFVNMMERGTKPLTAKAIEFIQKSA